MGIWRAFRQTRAQAGRNLLDFRHNSPASGVIAGRPLNAPTEGEASNNGNRL